MPSLLDKIPSWLLSMPKTRDDWFVVERAPGQLTRLEVHFKRLHACVSRRPFYQLRQRRRWLLFVNADIYGSPSHAVHQLNERIRYFGEV
ncbi:MAG: hypothetical protein WCE49_09365 [Terrimicrobiaceae bacterium]